MRIGKCELQHLSNSCYEAAPSGKGRRAGVNAPGALPRTGVSHRDRRMLIDQGVREGPIPLSGGGSMLHLDELKTRAKKLKRVGEGAGSTASSAMGGAGGGDYSRRPRGMRAAVCLLTFRLLGISRLDLRRSLHQPFLLKLAWPGSSPPGTLHSEMSSHESLHPTHLTSHCSTP